MQLLNSGITLQLYDGKFRLTVQTISHASLLRLKSVDDFHGQRTLFVDHSQWLLAHISYADATGSRRTAHRSSDPDDDDDAICLLLMTLSSTHLARLNLQTARATNSRPQQLRHQRSAAPPGDESRNCFHVQTTTTWSGSREDAEGTVVGAGGRR